MNKSKKTCISPNFLATFVAIFLFVSLSFAQRGVSLLWEHSFLTGQAVLDGDGHEFYNIDEGIIGGRVLFVLRYGINENLSLGLGSGASVSRLDAYYDFGGTWTFSTAMFFVPIFAEIRGQFPIYSDLLRIFTALKIGGSLSPLEQRFLSVTYSFDGGFFLEPSIGLSFGRRRALLDVGIGYSRQRSQFVEHYWRLPDDWSWSNDLPSIEVIERYPFTLRQLSLNLGVNFLFGRR